MLLKYSEFNLFKSNLFLNVFTFLRSYTQCCSARNVNNVLTEVQCKWLSTKWFLLLFWCSHKLFSPVRLDSCTVGVPLKHINLRMAMRKLSVEYVFMNSTCTARVAVQTNCSLVLYRSEKVHCYRLEYRAWPTSVTPFSDPCIFFPWGVILFSRLW